MTVGSSVLRNTRRICVRDCSSRGEIVAKRDEFHFGGFVAMADVDGEGVGRQRERHSQGFGSEGPTRGCSWQ